MKLTDTIENTKSVMNVHYSETYEIKDLAERRLFINGEIDDEVIDTIVYHILNYNREDKDIRPEDRKPIILYINSPGGSVYSGYALISAMQCSKTPIYTVNQGMCASMAFLIFLAGKKRFSMQNSTFLMHDGQSGAMFETTSKLRDRVEFETGQLEQHTKEYVLSRTSIDEKFYDEKYRVEWYMLPHEAKKYSICDYIVGEDCTIDEII